jgi:hypothetical protein
MNRCMKSIAASLAVVLALGLAHAAELPVTAGLMTHLDASALAGYSDGDIVTLWPDSSAAGRDATAAESIAPAYHANAVNGRPTLAFGGAASMSVANMFPPGDLTLFVVAKGQNYHSLLRWEDGGGAFFYGWNNWCVCSEANGFVYTNNIDFGMVANEWNISAGLFDIGEADGVRVYRNNVLQGAVTWMNPLTASKSTMWIASAGGSSEFGTCDIAEILVYGRALSDTEHLLVGSYLVNKYGFAGGYPPMVLANPVTRNPAFTGTNELVVLSLPDIAEGAEYQFTATPATEPAAGAWAAYRSASPPETATLPVPAAGGEWTVTLWVRTWDAGVATTNSFDHTMDYDLVGPTLLARDRTLVVNRFVGRDITVADIDAGTVDDAYGLASLAISPSHVGLGETEVTLTAVNNAGAVASATVTVTGVAGTVLDPFALPVTRNLRLHLDASALSGYAEGDAVLEWPDRSPGGRDALAPGEAQAPVYHASAANGRPALYFGGNHTLYVDDMLPGDELTLFVVAKGQNYQSLLRWQYQGSAFFFGHAGNNVSSEGPGNGFMGDGLLTLGLVANQWNISAGIFEVGATDGVEVFHDNVSRGTKTWPGALTTTRRLYIASSAAASEFATCEIPEIIVYDRALTAFEHAQVGAYLQQKYGHADGGYSPLSLAHPITGSTRYTCTNELAVLAFPAMESGVEYQLTASTDAASLDPAAWAVFDPSAPPARLFFPAPAADGGLTLVLWTRSMALGAATTNTFTQAITYSTAAPTALAQAITMAIDQTSGTVVPAALLDAGSYDNVSGLHSLSADPPIVTGGGAVDLVAMNQAGVTARASTTITCVAALDAHVAPAGDDQDGTGTAASPWRTITRALAALDGNGVVYAAPGTYAAAAGEVFPIVIGHDARIAAEPDGATAPVLDGGNAVAHLFSVTNGTLRLEGLTLRETTDAAIRADAASVSAKDCLFTQTASNHDTVGDWRFGYYGAADFRNGCTASFDGCTFRGIARYAVLHGTSGTTDLALRGCLFEDNNARGGMLAAIAAVLDITMEECDFVGNATAFTGGLSECSYCSIANLQGGGRLLANRCRFLGNAGANLFGFADSTDAIYHSLFAGNTPVSGLFQGRNATLSVYNSTFVDNSGGYSSNRLATKLYQCILSGETAMNVTNGGTLDRSNPAGTILHDTILWNCGEGDGWGQAASVNVIRLDPQLGNTAVAATDAAFDARPRPYSPAIDAGDNDRARTDRYTLDLDGNARVADNNADGVATIDLGAYESLFGASVEPAFEIPAPGSVSGLYGSSATIPVGVWPPPGGPVAAAISYPAGITGPATLAIADGMGPVDLVVDIAGDMTNETARLVISDAASPAAVKPIAVDFFLSDARVNAGHAPLRYVREGEVIRIPVSLELATATAPVAVEVAVRSVAGEGSNAIAWEGGATIPAGGNATDGALVVAGASGVNVATLSVGGGYFFAETGEETIELAFAGYPGWMAVDPADGDDALLVGTLENPMRSVVRALSVLRDGDTVRLLPGTYTAATETFPWTPGNVALVGYNPEGEANPSDHVVDGANTAATLVFVDGIAGPATNAVIGNLAFRETTAAPVDAAAATLLVRNALFTQSVTNTAATGGISLHDNARVTAESCVFRGIGRIATVFESAGTLNDDNRFTGSNCVFEANYSGYGTLSCATSVPGHYTLVGCDFLGNATPAGPRYYEVFPDTGVQVYAGGSFTVERCRFLGGRGGAVLGSAYAWNTVRDCLFAGNTCSAGMFQGVGWGMNCYNCTFVGNTGGYNSGLLQAHFYNSVFCGDGALSVMPPDEWMSDWAMSFTDTLLWDTPEGRTEGDKTYTDVLRVDPRLKNASVPWDHPAFDARPRGNSPAIDAGANENVATALDLDGAARLKHGTLRAAKQGGTPLVDLGCYEMDAIDFGAVLMLR